MDNADSSNQNNNNNTSSNPNSTAIVIDGDDQENRDSSQTNEPVAANRDNASSSSIPSTNNRGTSDDNSITITETTAATTIAPSAQHNQLPKNHPSHGSIVEAGDFSSATSLLGQFRDQEEEGGGAQREDPQQTAPVNETVLTNVSVSQPSDNAICLPSSAQGASENSGALQDVDRENIPPSAPHQPANPPGSEAASTSGTPPEHSSRRPLQNSDLSGASSVSNGGLVPSDATDSAALRKSTHRQRQANLRRTLVMGLGGEEEMIEIDEDDLDNMSILPPPYESIAGESVDRQQYTDI